MQNFQSDDYYCNSDCSECASHKNYRDSSSELQTEEKVKSKNKIIHKTDIDD